MNIVVRKSIKIIMTAILTFIILLTIPLVVILHYPALIFILSMNEIIPAWCVSAKEVPLIPGDGDKTRMTIYTRIFSQQDKYYFCIHGLTPQGYTHPSMVKLAKSLALATGRKVLVPYMHGSETDRDIIDATKEITKMYLEIRKQYPGKYNGFGACISGTMLVAALRDIPVELYPDKIFMYGPFLNGEMLIHFYNTSGMDVDFIVKLANAIRHPKLTQDEKKLVSKAIALTRPGVTDRHEMKQILGSELYNKIENLKVENPEFKQINEMTLFNTKKPLPNCQFYILHSKSDNIIPYSMGLSMHKYLQQLGLQSKFVATGAFQHTQKQPTVHQMISEFKEIHAFFEDLFKE